MRAREGWAGPPANWRFQSHLFCCAKSQASPPGLQFLAQRVPRHPPALQLARTLSNLPSAALAGAICHTRSQRAGKAGSCLRIYGPGNAFWFVRFVLSFVLNWGIKYTLTLYCLFVYTIFSFITIYKYMFIFSFLCTNLNRTKILPLGGTIELLTEERHLLICYNSGHLSCLKKQWMCKIHFHFC